MATVKICDKCGETVYDESSVTIVRKRSYINQHDGGYFNSEPVKYDLCEDCARSLEIMIIGEEKADAVHYV